MKYNLKNLLPILLFFIIPNIVSAQTINLSPDYYHMVIITLVFMFLVSFFPIYVFKKHIFKNKFTAIAGLLALNILSFTGLYSLLTLAFGYNQAEALEHHAAFFLTYFFISLVVLPFVLLLIIGHTVRFFIIRKTNKELTYWNSFSLGLCVFTVSVIFIFLVGLVIGLLLN